MSEQPIHLSLVETELLSKTLLHCILLNNNTLIETINVMTLNLNFRLCVAFWVIACPL
jgi:hypothetical protein